MGYVLPERPYFLEHALQGLAFWIGHRRSLFGFHPLPEGALVAEMSNLVHANLPHPLSLWPEYAYRLLVADGQKLEGIGTSDRADLVICDVPRGSERGSNLAPHVRYVIEVKRASTVRQRIDKDLKRLHELRRVHGEAVRCFLVVVSESTAPNRFVADGQAKKGPQRIPNDSGWYFVRRAVKASASFSNKRTAHYACLIEVFTKPPAKLPPV